MAKTPAQIKPAPGIQRDGTRFDSQHFVDGRWTRFYRQRPQKMGGYNSIIHSLPEIARGISSFTQKNVTYVHTGGQEFVMQTAINSSGAFSGLADRTPSGLILDANRLWQFDILYDSADGSNVLIAHGPPNLNDISNDEETEIFYGPVTSTAPLTDTSVAGESGGILAVAPYLFKFGNDGHVAWSVPNQPADFAGSGSGEAWITPQKIIRGLPLRGGGQGPAALFWSLDALIRGSFVGSTNGVWAFDPIASEISVLSSQSIIEYDGNYYWVGLDRFMQFNGVVRELPNEMNIDWFFQNLNVAQRQKVFAFKIPKYGEIWWCFPFGSATECTHAVIYNVRHNFWYDTELPNSGRTCGLFAKVYSKPLMTGVDYAAATDGYALWQHESGLDEINGAHIEPVRAYFQTNEISLVGLDEGAKNKALSVSKLEPDFKQQGNLRLRVCGRANARAPEVQSATIIIPQTASNSYEQQTGVKVTHRLMSFRFESNEQGGNFEMGKTLMHLEESDGRELQ